ncbi:MAG: hypothetical protein JW909_09530 [Planctomycetes bacterium]|nr:hypothetical protein [Planctomycetota bacterium]
MQIQIELPEPDDLSSMIKVDVNRVRLEADPEWKKAAQKLETGRTMRRISEAVYSYLSTPGGVAYEEKSGVLKFRDLSGRIDLLFNFLAGTRSDRYRFSITLSQDGLHYNVVSALKECGEPWGGGVVPDEWKEVFTSHIGKHPVVWGLSERMVRVVEPQEISWEWQPSWNLKNILVPQVEQTLDKVFPGETDIPKVVLLATWGFTLDEHDWGANGNRVQLLIDPSREEVVGAWEDEWHVLY